MITKRKDSFLKGNPRGAMSRQSSAKPTNSADPMYTENVAQCWIIGGVSVSVRVVRLGYTRGHQDP